MIEVSYFSSGKVTDSTDPGNKFSEVPVHQGHMDLIIVHLPGYKYPKFILNNHILPYFQDN